MLITWDRAGRGGGAGRGTRSAGKSKKESAHPKPIFIVKPASVALWGSGQPGKRLV